MIWLKVELLLFSSRLGLLLHIDGIWIQFGEFRFFGHILAKNAKEAKLPFFVSSEMLEVGSKVDFVVRG